MFQLFKKGGRKIGGLLLGIQIILVFFVSTNAVYAQAAPPTSSTITDSAYCDTGSITLGPPTCYSTLQACKNSGIFMTCTLKAPVEQKADKDAYAQGLRGKAAAAAGKGGELLGKGALWVVGEVLELIAQVLNTVAGIFMRAMGHILDIAIAKTIDSRTYTDLTAVLVGWTAVRDLSNMLFIFVLLFIAIQTILGLAGGNAKRWLSHVIIAALLINFSLFLTGVVIDAGNVLAMGFWGKITTQEGPDLVNTATAPFLKAFTIQTTFDTTGIETEPMNRAMIYAGGALIMFVAGYVFLAGAVMMIIRTVTLLILMIVSPFAFLGFALPKGGGFANQWLSKLISNAFVAPAFLAMLYIDAQIINSLDLNTLGGANGSRWSKAFLGAADNFAVVYQFVLCIILLLASLTVANSVSNGAGSAGGAWAKRLISGGAAAGMAGAGMYGRQFIGSAGTNQLKNEEWVKEQNRLVAKASMKDAKFADKLAGRTANLKLSTAEKISKGSFDIRNAPMGGLGVTAGLGAAGIKTGVWSKKSYATTGSSIGAVTAGYRGTEKEKELLAIAKAHFPNDPAAQKAYLEQRGVELDASRNKDAKEALNKDISKEENKEAAKESNEKYKDLETQLQTATGTNVQKIQDEMLGVAKDLRQSMQRMTGEDVAKLMEKPEYRNSKALQAGLSSKDYSAINKRYMEGGYKGVQWTDAERAAGKDDTALMAALTATALTSDQVPENTKRMIKNQMKNGTWGHDINFEKEVIGIVSSGQDAQGNYIAKPDLSDADKVKLKEIRSMMDHEDVASLHDSLLLNEHMVKTYNPNTLAAIGKKQLEKGGEANTAFVNQLRDTVLRNSENDRTLEYVTKNTGKKESFFNDDALKNKYTPQYLERLKALKAAQKNGPLNQADTAELNSLNLVTTAWQSGLDEKQRAARLQALYAKGVNITPAEQAEITALS